MKILKFPMKILLIFLLLGTPIQINAEKNNSITVLKFKNLFSDIDEHIEFPKAIRVDKKENYYILDRKKHCIKVFNSDFKYSHLVGEVGQGEGELYYPEDFCIDKSQIIYIADTGNKRIQFFRSDGQYHGGFNLKFLPRSIQINSKGEIYVTGNADLQNNTIISVFNMQGKLLRNFGDVEKVKYNDELIKKVFNRKAFLHIDQKDNIYLAFYAIPRFRKYNSKERLIFEKEITGTEINAIQKKAKIPIPDHKNKVVSDITGFVNDIVVDSNENILIATAAPYIYLYNKNGEKIKIYHCYYSENEEKKEIGLFKIIYLEQSKIIGINPYTNCIISRLE